MISNLEGPFMGSPRRLRAKIAGVEAKRTGTPFAEGRLVCQNDIDAKPIAAFLILVFSPE